MKRTFTKLRVLLPAAVWLAVACTEDPTAESMPQGRALRFDVVQDDGWNTSQSRAAVEDEIAAAAASQLIRLQGDTPADTLFLHVTVSDGIEPRAAESAEAKTRADRVEDISQLDEFAVDGYSYVPGAWSSSLTPNLMEVLCVEEGNGIWRPSDRDYYWPGAKKKARFFAYAPGLLGQLKQENSQSFIYRGAGEPVEADWLFADSGELDGDMNAPIPLSFRHIWSCVKFVAGDDMMGGKITRIDFANHYRDAVFSFGTAAWSSLEQCSSQGLTVNWNTDGMPDSELGSVFLTPQVFPEDARLTITFTDALSSTKRTLSASLAGLELPMGKTVTFRLSTSSILVEPVLQVEWYGGTFFSVDDIPQEGGGQFYKVSSYLDIYGADGVATRVAVPWVAEFSTDDGRTWTTQKPEWLTIFTSEGAGGFNPSIYEVMVPAQQDGVFFNPHDDALRAATPVAGTYDLSTKGGTTAMNTANCYIVNAPGRYSLPLVYGNAIKNGENNTNAYTYTGDISLIQGSDFPNHLFNKISDPFICNNADCVPADATLVWQDAKDLVTNVSLSQDGKDLLFEVAASTIKQGNAVVAVRDAEGIIMWSWHIWVTDYVPGLPATLVTDDGRDKVVTDFQGVQHTVMPVNVGWCYGGYYPDRDVKVRFVQTGVGRRAASYEFTIAQSGYVNVDGNNPYFQWGRKDPMLPGCWDESSPFVGKLKKCYDGNGEEITSLKTANGLSSMYRSSLFAIRNPDVFIFDVFAGGYRYLWCANFSTTPITVYDSVKTVYDPSPVGYQVPGPYDFTFMLPADADFKPGSLNCYSDLNGDSNKSIFAKRGVYFYCNEDRTGPLIFFPCSGIISYHFDTSAFLPGYIGLSGFYGVNICDIAIFACTEVSYLYYNLSWNFSLNTPFYASSIRSVRER